ncbi:MAG: DUF2079 domain-containing protein [Candidatus Aureabacteria bacterium]|nr:DUF2079 domain-containing protein [Candidatus Auribacterota bacterium]
MTGIVLALYGLIFGSYAAFTWNKFQLTDYGKYVNTVWNCGHGHLFKFLVDENYLNTHLSYSLALLGPFFLIWDHPFLLSVLQWMGLIIGGFIFWRTARLRQVNHSLAAALVFLYTAYPYTQSVMLSEFHGVAFYYLLVPWLYHGLCFQKRWVWIPFLITLGLREDAPFILIPFFLYFAVTDRWKPGYVYALSALIFGLIGLGVVFPSLSGVSLMERRPDLGKLASYTQRMGWEGLELRSKALFWLFLPVLPFIKKGWIPILLFPLVGLIQSMITPYPFQYSLYYHYPASVFTCLFAGIVEAVSRNTQNKKEVFLKLVFLPLYLFVITVIAHHERGYLWGGKEYSFVYGTMNQKRDIMVALTAKIPKEGVLLCSVNLAGLCANRKDLISWEYWDPEKMTVDIFFLTFKDVIAYRNRLLPLLRKNEYVLIYQDERRIILQRGSSDPSQMSGLIEKITRFGEKESN